MHRQTGRDRQADTHYDKLIMTVTLLPLGTDGRWKRNDESGSVEGFAGLGLQERNDLERGRRTLNHGIFFGR